MSNPVLISFRPRFLPESEPLQPKWYQQFLVNLTPIAGTLGVTPAQLESLQADCVALTYIINTWLPAVRTFNSGATSAKNLLFDNTAQSAWTFPKMPDLPWTPDPPHCGIYQRLSAVVRDIKASENYTETIGKALDILPPPPPPPTELVVRSTESLPGSVVVTKLLKGRTKMIEIQSRRGPETEFWPLDKIISNLMTDARTPLVANTPERRDYRFRSCDGKGPCSDWTPILSVVTMP